MISILLLLLLTILVYLKIIKPYSYWNDRGVKHKKPIFLLGDFGGILLRKESFYEVMMRLYNLYPDERYTGLYQSINPVLLIKDIDLIKQIGVKEFEHFVDHRAFIPEDVDPFWSKNLFALRGSKWRQMRTTLSPSFTSSKMKMIFTLISECAEQYVEYFSKTDDPQTIELKDTFTRYANDVIATVAFGVKCNSIEQKTNEFYLMGQKATVFPLWRNIVFFIYNMMPPLSKILGVGFFAKSVSHFFNTVIVDTIKTREEKAIVRPDMIHLLLEARKGKKINDEKPNDDAGFATVEEVFKSTEMRKSDITDTDITAQALIFFFAGFETVSVLMSFVGYELALNPDIQKKLQKEIDDTLKHCDGKLTYEALVKMKYMDMVVTETLRKWPPVLSIDRECTKPYTIQPTNPNEKAVTLQRGDVIFIPICGIHRDPKYYPNPDTFDPERFNDQNKDQIKPYTFLPFGLGPRNCIGSRMALLETKIIFFYILQKFDIVTNEKTDIPLTLSKTSFNLLAEKGMWLDLIPRKC